MLLLNQDTKEGLFLDELTGLLRVSCRPWGQGEISISRGKSYLSINQGLLVVPHTFDFCPGGRGLYRTVVTWTKGGSAMSKDEGIIFFHLGVPKDSCSRSLSSSWG